MPEYLRTLRMAHFFFTMNGDFSIFGLHISTLICKLNKPNNKEHACLNNAAIVFQNTWLNGSEK